jgi:aspartate kinase
VVVVAGFQGVDEAGNITTLRPRRLRHHGRWHWLRPFKADECLIYTDVDGVYTTDPRVVPEARKLDML